MMSLTKGRYSVRTVQGLPGFEQTRDLRQTCFPNDALTGDAFDRISTHLIVTNQCSGAVVACLRMMDFAQGSELARSYSAQFYDLAALQPFKDRMIEIGRFCLCPDEGDADVLRVIWGALAAYVDHVSAVMLFGCSSFDGLLDAPYSEGFALLESRYLAPKSLAPREKAPEVIRFAKGAGDVKDAGKALSQLPALLRMYVSMGGWVSDHAVVDRNLGTLHVFTGLNVASIPEARRRVLRSVFAAD